MRFDFRRGEGAYCPFERETVSLKKQARARPRRIPRCALRIVPELKRFENLHERSNAWHKAYGGLPGWCRACATWLPALAMVCTLIASSLLGPRYRGPEGVLLTVVRVLLTWATFLLTYMAVLYCFRTRLRRAVRKHLSRLGLLICVPCGYVLRGLEGHRCPECGRAFRWETQMP